MDLAGKIKTLNKYSDKSDINNIKKLLSTNEQISIDSVASKGYKLSYQDELTYKELKEAIKNVNDNQELNNQKTRVNTIIYTLMNYPKGINKVKLMNSINVSESTLYPILKRLEAQDLLKTYNRQYNGRTRKYYEITKKGRKRIEEFLDEWQEIEMVINFIKRRTR